MKITGVDIYEYSLPMKQPLAVKGNDSLIREGFLLRLRDDDRRQGWGEAAPLKGFSQETLEQARHQLIALKQELLDVSTEDKFASIFSGTATMEFNSKTSPSVEFGLGSAILELLASHKKRSPGELLTNKVSRAVNVNALLDGDSDNILSTALLLYESGYRTFKIKLGRKELAEEIELVKRLLGQMPGDIKLRLDCNRSWSTEQLREFLSNVELGQIEYIEEPLHGLLQYEELSDDCRFPLALDESLVHLHPGEINSIKNLVVVVLKPTMLGITRTIGFARAAQRHGFQTTISSTFETSVGTTMLAHLASAYSSPGHAAGLDTVTWFAEDLLDRPISIENGCIDLSAHPIIGDKIRMDALREVPLNE